MSHFVPRKFNPKWCSFRGHGDKLAGCQNFTDLRKCNPSRLITLALLSRVTGKLVVGFVVHFLKCNLAEAAGTVLLVNTCFGLFLESFLNSHSVSVYPEGKCGSESVYRCFSPVFNTRRRT